MYGRIIKLRYYFFAGKNLYGSLSRDKSTWPLHFLPQNCSSLRSGQFNGKKCLVHVEISLEKEPLDTFPAK